MPICIKPFRQDCPLMEKAVIERLRTFGINEMEARLYFTLLNCGAETAGELVNVTEVARADVYKALNGLLEKGMIEESTERPTRYCAVPIETALDAAVMKQAYHLRQMERSKQELVELVNRQVPAGPSEAAPTVFK
ncbi:MAG: TrmB family transcriptional regulator [Halobacteriota archaeon]